MTDEAGRAIVFLGEDALVRLLNLAPGMRVVATSHDFARLGILVAVEAAWLPPRRVGMVAPELPTSPELLDTTAKIARLESEIAGLRRQLAEAEKGNHA